MAAPVCAFSGAFTLVDFQGHVLDLANNVNPVISQTRNPTPTANQQVRPVESQPHVVGLNGISPVVARGRQRGHSVLASGLSGPQGEVVLSWATSASTSPLFMQAFAAPGTSIAFDLHCVNSTSASFVDSATGQVALTAWPMESGSTITPVRSVRVDDAPSGSGMRLTHRWRRLKVTFESFTGRAEQVWTLEQLD
ncbi:hypothetical protein B0H13DRAFT_2027700 [Mycena leptocephala]|nr:hypothetical protein B0H13DRAFT_2027700 [Mycena leptocephala]